TRGCSAGGRYVVSHKMSHVMLSTLVNTKANGHPHLTVTHGTIRGATIAPILAPALKIPVANARSRRGNHSATVLMAAGKLPDSPNPRKKRASANPTTVRTSAWLMAARLQMQIASA